MTDAQTEATDRLTDQLATKILQGITERRAEYDTYVREMWSEGHAPQYCIHGRNLWVDHDIPCWTCEMESDETDVQRALRLAQDTIFDWHERMGAVTTLCRLNAPREAVASLTEWACEPLTSVLNP